MTLSEDAIEQDLINLLQQQGYTYFNDSTIAPSSDNPQRDAFDSVVLEKQFSASLRKLNPDIPESALHEAFQHVLHLGSSDIMTNNEKFHQKSMGSDSIGFVHPHAGHGNKCYDEI